MDILIEHKYIGTTSSEFIYYNEKEKILIFSSDINDKFSAYNNSNSLTKILENITWDKVGLLFGSTEYKVSEINVISNEYGNEVALKAKVVEKIC